MSLHTKHRPATFKKVVGHEKTIKSLQKVVKDKRAHTFLFTGPAGTGKTSLARIVANELCDGEATPANLLEIPAANYTGVGDMRDILNKVASRAIGKSPIKVVILDEAHRLSGNAWDSLLKATEEPPAHVYYILCTTNPAKVPKTIVTRCIQFDLSPLTEEDLVKIMKRVCKAEGLEVEEEVIEAISEAAQGSARQALVWLEACLYCETASEARKVMQQAGESPEIIDFCRFLMQRNGRDWKSAMKILSELKPNFEAESVRIVVCNYLANVLINTKAEKQALPYLQMLECFSTSYNPSEKYAPLIISVAEALGVGE